MRAMRLVWNGSSCDDYVDDKAKVNRFTELFYVVFTTNANERDQLIALLEGASSIDEVSGVRK